jgi:hypothetical protein
MKDRGQPHAAANSTPENRDWIGSSASLDVLEKRKIWVSARFHIPDRPSCDLVTIPVP